ncbi:DUF294 nucleotidyltransferase-like domain-containing protein [Effusibacillus dendaii]|uniref:Nucleotidyltransferase n=1 Tax=Effusibacillus dendaii TaxID=2743772 RepID=A0A7I8D551_9BACL|nr:DUF294 nucleotidyltransferase-like domain-containing protein [Effusibacillus dendaii]BCJ85224.1 hypothetical protein skT53_02090 [Effusibacillus dendaii]
MEADRKLSLTWIKNEVGSANDVRTLRAIHDQMPDMALAWQKQGMHSTEIHSSINCWHDTLIGRVIELVLADMEQAGWGTPPSPFCWLLLGSGGRREQTLQPDQDNALLYLGGSAAEQDEVKLYFKSLAERVVTRLAEIGYPYCPGFVMATNPRWNLSLQNWQEQIQSYTDVPNWDHTRFLMMAADIRAVFGDPDLPRQFRGWLIEHLRCQPFVHWQVASHGLQQSVPLDFRGRFLVDKWGEHAGEFHLKDTYLQLVNCVRLWSIANGIEAVATLSRIQELHQRCIWEPVTADGIANAFLVLMGHRLWSNYVPTNRLSDADKTELANAIKRIRALQKLTAKKFRKPE